MGRTASRTSCCPGRSVPRPSTPSWTSSGPPRPMSYGQACGSTTRRWRTTPSSGRTWTTPRPPAPRSPRRTRRTGKARWSGTGPPCAGSSRTRCSCGPGPSRPRASTLLGRGRASVLRRLGGPLTTAGLADRLGLAPSTVSEHLSVLADAGVVTRHRVGRSVYYQLTDTGRSLLALLAGEDVLRAVS
ncbi:ArsR/SmtB family transcription factor [Streptomyces cyaneofuscatus]|uniref:ArsR/SmtB family transcription factor n=1 Tax=Streptomyces cyaneofuscatus TaxID=66883 RepID=UPI00341B874C